MNVGQVSFWSWKHADFLLCSELTESNVLDDIEDDTDFNHLLNPLPNVAGDGDTRNKEDEQDDDDGDDDNEREDDFGPDSDVTDNEDGLWGRTCSTEEEAGSDGHQRREDDEYLALLAELDLEQDLREDHVRGQEEALDMEDGMEDDFSKIDHAYTKYFPGAAADYGLGTTLSDKFKSDRFADIRAKYNNIFYPFASQKEWEFTNVLLRIHCSLSEKTELVKTQLVSTRVCWNSEWLTTQSRCKDRAYRIKRLKKRTNSWNIYRLVHSGVIILSLWMDMSH